MNARMSVPSRVVLVDKPVGWTSFDAVRRARRGLKEKVGHAGTLDPFATGLLLILVGQATRLSNLFMELPKEYVVEAQFGAVSTTGDPDGEIRSTGERVAPEAVMAALDAFRGVVRQQVPMTSAVKVEGEALYRRAHRGETIERPIRNVEVYDLALVDFDAAMQRGVLIVRAGKGTYVRQLVHDLGEALGAGAYAAALRRTRIGAYSVSDALEPESLGPETYLGTGPGVLAVSGALGFLPRHDVDGSDARRAANGNELYGTPAGRFRVQGPEGLIGVYEGPVGVSRPLVVFSRPEA